MKINWLMVMVFALTCTLAGAATLDDVITNAAQEICKDLPKGARIAIVSFDSDSERVSDYIMEELTYAFRRSGHNKVHRSATA